MNYTKIFNGTAREHLRRNLGGIPDELTSSVTPVDAGYVVILHDAERRRLGVYSAYTSMVYRTRRIDELAALLGETRSGVPSVAVMTDIESLNNHNLSSRIRGYQLSAAAMRIEREQLLADQGDAQMSEAQADVVDWMSRRADADEALAAWMHAESVIHLTPGLALVENQNRTGVRMDTIAGSTVGAVR